MSLYYDAATVLTNNSEDGSLKSRIYGNRLGLKSKPAHLYALISETAKVDVFLKEVVDNAALLSQEPKLTPTLSLLLLHDHLFAKNGIAAAAAHPLRQAVERHKARLQAESTRARLRRRCAALQDLKARLTAENPRVSRSKPRWIRVNTLRSSLTQVLSTTFHGYRSDATIAEVVDSPASTKVLAIDSNIPDVVALPPDVDLTKTPAYRDGSIILQDKASCFPAYLLIGEEDTRENVGDCLDGCAAPGNKTSHLAALLGHGVPAKNNIFACERDRARSATLVNMMERSGSTNVSVLAECDFLTLDVNDQKYRRVTHLLLDPSCSGSGIVGREDVPSLALPADPRAPKTPASTADKNNKKKRKRQESSDPVAAAALTDPTSEEDHPVTAPDQARLRKLSGLQAKIVEHALSFPAAIRVTYSTCSVHRQENEEVVARVLGSKTARDRGWRLLRRDEQPTGLREWKLRGTRNSESKDEDMILEEDELEACIRCYPGDEQGTMGFFVCCFSRPLIGSPTSLGSVNGDDLDADDWEGFDD